MQRSSHKITISNVDKYIKTDDGNLVYLETGEIIGREQEWGSYNTALRKREMLENPYMIVPWNKNKSFVKFYGCDVKFDNNNSLAIMMFFISNLSWGTNEVLIEEVSPSNKFLSDYFNIHPNTLKLCLYELNEKKVIFSTSNNRYRKIFFNPKYAFNGILILKQTLEYF